LGSCGAFCSFCGRCGKSVEKLPSARLSPSVPSPGVSAQGIQQVPVEDYDHRQAGVLHPAASLAVKAMQQTVEDTANKENQTTKEMKL